MSDLSARSDERDRETRSVVPAAKEGVSARASGKDEPERDGRAAVRDDAGRGRSSGVPPRARLRVLPILVTFCVAGVATFAGWMLWQAYMASPWTRDGTVRVYVVTVAPEVAGQVVDLPVRDNQFVHKGDLLMRIDPRDYRVAVDLAQAAVDQASADATNKQSQAARRLQLTDLATTPEQKEQYVSAARMAEANVEQQKANLDRARINMERTEIRSPVNGWVTNLLTQQGNYATTGQTSLSVVDADSYWVDGYFEETTIAPIREGDAAKIWLLGYAQVIVGHVDSIARGIVVSNAQPGQSGLATVNPIFTWVRLAQRVPVRIHIDRVPPDVRLVAGMTATVEIDPRPIADRPPVTDTGVVPGAGAPRDGRADTLPTSREAAPQDPVSFTAPISAAGSPGATPDPALGAKPSRSKP